MSGSVASVSSNRSSSSHRSTSENSNSSRRSTSSRHSRNGAKVNNTTAKKPLQPVPEKSAANLSSNVSVSTVLSNDSSMASKQSHRSSGAASVASRSSRQSSASKSSVNHQTDTISNNNLNGSTDKISSNSSVASHQSHRSSGASVVSQASTARSHFSSTTSSTSRSHHTSDASTSTFKTVRSTRGENTRSVRNEGITYYNSGNYRLAILLFTQALGSYTKYEGGNPAEGGTEERIERTLATLYGYRCGALYEVGAYEAAVRDARSALECERISGCKRTLMSALGRASGNATGSEGCSLLHPEKGAVLRAKVLALLGYSLLRSGIVEGVADALEGSIDVANKALDDAEDLTESERMASSSHQRAVTVIQETVQMAKDGLGELGRYEMLKTKLVNETKKRDYISDCESAMEIAPGAIMWNVALLRYYIKRRRWFAVANHCEQLAVRNMKLEEVYSGDLAEVNQFPGIPSVQELTADFFEDNGDKSIPPYLRVVGTKAACDVAFRLPKELLPHYLRALRLEERYKAAVQTGTALAEFDNASSPREDDVRASLRRSYAEKARLKEEFLKLERTIKLKEEGDALFRDGYFDRAAQMYGECLTVDESPNGNSATNNGATGATRSGVYSGGKIHAVLHSNRAACFSSLGRYRDAVAESTYAIDIHSMYMKAILRRARCFVKVKDISRAQADFNRWIVLVEGAHIKQAELNAVRSEMNELGITPTEPRGRKSKARGGSVRSAPRGSGGASSNASSRSLRSRSSRAPPQTAFRPDPPINPSIIKSRPAFDHPLEPTSIIDVDVDYYAALELDVLASPSLSDIKQSYHRLAKQYHPDRNRSDPKAAELRFQEVKAAFDVLGDKSNKMKYDKERTGKLEP
ncbi:predicted protein [Thalassiosira pseudonana CCMP1335]|uniref:J domain-containing protein n=1 Tax=Thalassiosira pseudonana TaxID=35128 RepID=B8C986_THAPS|nr:predicted protein [Thalassiosira pseudonana CCMP1335]EED89810.1 predicted protein [Thalassiosira pseudonana CCMP1335]